MCFIRKKPPIIQLLYTASGEKLYFFEHKKKLCFCPDESRHYGYDLKKIIKLYKTIYKTTPHYIYRKKLGYDRYAIHYEHNEIKLELEGVSIFTFKI